MKRLLVCPSPEVGLGEAAPPHLILKPPNPLRMPHRPRHQAIAPLFYRAYCGSGLVIQCFARFQWVARRLRARRMVSSRIRRSVTPCAEHTSAAKANVHTPVGLP